MRKIEAVSVCVGYADILSHCLPVNRMIFDNYVIVTHPDDVETVRVCNYYMVKCVTTEDFYKDGAVFNKFAGINRGLEELRMDDWVLHLDADIYLPPIMSKVLREVPLEMWRLYGIDRVMLHSFEEFLKYQNNPDLIHENWLLRMDAYTIGSRINQYYGDGWIPLGFFHLWRPVSSGVRVYDHDCTAADRCDVVFAKRWNRRDRGFLPEIIGIHLDSEKLEIMGKNWKGRKTKPFKLENSYK